MPCRWRYPSAPRVPWVRSMGGVHGWGPHSTPIPCRWRYPSAPRAPSVGVRSPPPISPCVERSQVKPSEVKSGHVKSSSTLNHGRALTCIGRSQAKAGQVKSSQSTQCRSGAHLRRAKSNKVKPCQYRSPRSPARSGKSRVVFGPTARHGAKSTRR